MQWWIKLLLVVADQLDLFIPLGNDQYIILLIF